MVTKSRRMNLVKVVVVVSRLALQGEKLPHKATKAHWKS